MTTRYCGLKLTGGVDERTCLCTKKDIQEVAVKC